MVAEGSSEGQRTFVDPVCGERLTEAEAVASCEHNDRTFHFKHIKCKMLFEGNPEQYLSAGGGAAGRGTDRPTSGEFHASLSAGRPITTVPPKVPAAKSSVPYMTLGLAALAIGVTAIIAVSVGGGSDTIDEPQADFGADADLIATGDLTDEDSDADASKEGITAADEGQAAADDAAGNAADSDAALPIDEPPAEEVADASPLAEPQPQPKPPQPAAPEPVPAAPAPAPAPRAPTATAGTTGQYQRTLRERVQMQYDRGNAYLLKNWISSAVASYERAIELNPNFTKAFGPLGVAYTLQGDETKAQAAFDSFLRPLPPESHAEQKRELIERFAPGAN